MPLKLNDETLKKENENETEVKMTKEQEELYNKWRKEFEDLKKEEEEVVKNPDLETFGNKFTIIADRNRSICYDYVNKKYRETGIKEFNNLFNEMKEFDNKISEDWDNIINKFFNKGTNNKEEVVDEQLSNNDAAEADKNEGKEDISNLFVQPESRYNAELTEEAREGFENKINEYNKITSIEEYKQNVASRLENAKTHEELLNLATEIYYDYNNPENEQYKEKLKIYFQHVNKKGLELEQKQNETRNNSGNGENNQHNRDNVTEENAEKNKDIKLISGIKELISLGTSLSLLKTARDFRKLDKGAKSIVDSIDTSLDNSVERYNANKKVRKEISDLKGETRKVIKETKVGCKNIISTERKKIFESYIDYAKAALGKRKADRDMSKYKRSPEYIKYLEEISRLKDDIIKEQNQNIRNSKNRKLLEFMGKSKEILIEREQQQYKNKSKEANKQITSSKERIDSTKKYYNEAVSKYTGVRDEENGEKSKDLVKQTAFSKMLGAIGSVVDKTIGKNKIYNEIKKVKNFVKGIPSGVASTVGSASTGIFSSLKGKIMAKVAQMENELSSLKNENNPERVNRDQTRDNDGNEYGEQ